MQKVNLLVESADEYLRANRIMELLEDLCTAACFKQPDQLEEFIIQELKTKQKQGFKTAIFTDSEIHNIFDLFDLKREGYITKERCRQALLTMASSEQQSDIISQTDAIDDKIDYARFSRLCEIFIGVRQSV